MKKRDRTLALLLTLAMTLALLSGCGSTAQTPAAETPTEAPAVEPAADAADLVLTNGTIQTMVSEDDTAEAVAVKDGEIVYVGTSEGVKDFIGESTNVIDLAGKYVTPGFIDGHIHAPGPYLTGETVLSLMEYGADLEAYKAAAKEFVDSHPDYDIYLIEAFDLKAFPDSVPENSWLDEICADKPIKCTDVSTHGALLNTCAIEMCGITKDTPNPPKGVIYKDSAGELTGYFSDCNTILGDLPSFNYTEEQYAEAFKAFQAEANSYGLTGIDSGGNLDNIDLGFEARVFQTLEAAGELNLRINSNFFFFAPLNAERAQTAIDTIRENEKYASDFLNVRQVKFTVDGVPEGKSAFLLEPYDEAAGMESDYVSSPAASPEELMEFITAVNAAGYTVQTHCMGDASMRMAMDAYEHSAEVNGNPDVRNKIAHVNLLTDEDVVRMAEYKVIAAMQPLWFYYDPFFSPLEEQMFGTERFEREYHIRDMIDAGVIITGSNDYPVTLDFAPLHAIEAGATQCSPYAGEDQDIETYTRNAAQAATVYEMLEMYTTNAAYGAFLDDRVGTIEVGKRADLVVLGDNLLTCDVKAISDVPVIYTISDGRIVYDASAAADLVLTNGTIQTMVSEDDTAEAVAVKNGEIVYVGTSEGVKEYIGEGTNVIDLAGKYVTPGFIDGHIHGHTPYVTAKTELRLTQYGTDLEAYKTAVKEFVDSNPDYDIYLIKSLDLKAFPDSAPENSWLDEICTDKPIKCTDVSNHGALLNTCAIEMCGITKDTPNPPKGVIYKDSAGELTGYFSDCNTILGDLPSFNYTEEQYAEAFKAFQAEANSYGLTGIDCAGNSCLDLGREVKVYNALEAADELNLRINSNFFFFAPLNAERAQTVIDTIRENEKYASDFLNVRQVKFTVDGVPEGKSAFLLEPYDEAAGMDADYVSSPAASPEELKEFITAVNAAGYTVQTHCMGDASVKIAMDAYENSAKVNGNPDVRNKIAHVNLLTDEDVDRMAEYKVIAAMQPLWFYYDPFFSPLEEQMFGTERFQREYHIRDMIDAGVIITGSNDYPVTLDFAPLHAIEAGATQCSPYAGEDQDIETYTRNAAQAATVYEMLEMYTTNAAYGAFLDDRVGTIEVGKRADLVVLGDNLLTCDVKAISDVPVIYTISDGRIVYEG